MYNYGSEPTCIFIDVFECRHIEEFNTVVERWVSNLWDKVLSEDSYTVEVFWKEAESLGSL